MQEVANQHPTAFADVFNDPAVGARRANVAAGTVIYEPDDAAQNVHFIHRGQVRLYQVGPEGTQRLVEILGPGDWFGVAALARAEKYGPVIDQPSRALLGDPRFVRHELFRVRPHRHTSCADEDSIPLLQRGALFGQCPLEVRGGNFVGVGQQRHPFLGGHVNENPASNNGRDFISAGFGPPLVPEILPLKILFP